MAPWAVVLFVVIVVLLLAATARRRSPHDGDSTAGHYDPNAIGGYTLDPATMRYRYDLPTLPPGTPAEPGSGPPERSRRRRRRTTDAEGG